MKFIKKFSEWFGNGEVMEVTDLIDILNNEIKNSMGNTEANLILSDTIKSSRKEMDKLYIESGLKDDLSVLGMDHRDIMSFNKTIISNISNTISNARNLISKLEDEDMFASKGLSEKQKALLSLVYRTMNESNLYSNIMLLTSYKLNEEEVVYRSKYEDTIKYFTTTGAKVYDGINRDLVRKTLMSLDKLSTEAGSGVRDNNSSIDKSGLSNGFTGNIIYHIGLIRESFKKNRYDANVVAAKLTALKLAELKAKLKDGDTKQLEDAIAFYEDKLTKLEYEIKEYRDE